MAAFDSSKILAETFVGHVEYHETLESTNALAVELLPDLQNMAPALVLTSQQTAGRGRGSNQWWASSGALTFSVVINEADLKLPHDRISIVALAVGLGVRNIVALYADGRSVTVKWPNDVLVSGRKVCGILVERHMAGDHATLVIGVGVNVNNSLANAPVDVQQKAVSVFDLTARSADLTEFLVSVLRSIEAALQQLRHRERELFAELNANSCLNDREVKLQVGGETIVGFCRGIDSDGCLVLESVSGMRRVNAGTVIAW